VNTLAQIQDFLRESGLKLAVVYTQAKYLAVVSKENFSWTFYEDISLEKAILGAIQAARKKGN